MTHSFTFDILKERAEQLGDGPPIMAIFDIDSTLLEVCDRHTAVLRAFAESPTVITGFPELREHLLDIEVMPHEWGFEAAFERTGIAPYIDDIFWEELDKYWISKFFSNEFLHCDRPYKNSVETLVDLTQRNIDVHYLTGRTRRRMYDGSVQTLRDFGYPLSEDAKELHLKPHNQLRDEDFKLQFFLNTPKNRYSEIWFFENEPTNINAIHRFADFVKLVFVDTVHSNRETPPTDIYTMKDFI